ATAAAADLANVQKTLPGLTDAVKPANDQLAAAQKKVTEVQAQVTQAPKLVEAKTAAVKAAQMKAAADQTALDQANSAVKAAVEKVDKLKAAIAKNLTARR